MERARKLRQQPTLLRLTVAVPLLLSLGLAAPARSASFALESANSSLRVELGSAGLSDQVVEWSVDDVSQLARLSWFVATNERALQPLESLGLHSTTQTGPDRLAFDYGARGGLRVEVALQLLGGPSGSRTSGVTESIVLENASVAPLSVSLVEYVDLDLDDRPATDAAAFVPPRQIQQIDASRYTNTFLVAADVVEIAPFRQTLDRLDSGLGLVPSAGPVGPGDVTVAVQWSRLLAPGERFALDQSHLIDRAPEPAGLAVLGMVLLLGHARRPDPPRPSRDMLGGHDCRGFAPGREPGLPVRRTARRG